MGRKPERISLCSVIYLFIYFFTADTKHTHWFDLGWLSFCHYVFVWVCVCVNSLLSFLSSVKGSVYVFVCAKECVRQCNGSNH